jgi:hypothetical protein
VQYKDKLIYSKHATGRFPEEGEILRIVANLDKGLPLEQAQAEAAKGIPPTPTFLEWLASYLKRQPGKAAK